MQYALYKIHDRSLLVDAWEAQALQEHGDDIRERPAPPEELPFHLCYGCYLPQRGIDPNQAREDLLQAGNHWLGAVRGQECHLIGLQALEAFPVVEIGHEVRIPFAALIQAESPVLDWICKVKSSQAVSTFLRYADLTPATNILNRNGILALKGLERRIAQAALTLENWQRHIDATRAQRIASAIR